eukprot:gene13757-15196_t
MDGWLAATLGTAVPAGVLYMLYWRKRDYCKILESIKLYPLNEDLKALAEDSPDGLQYAAVSGYAKAINQPIISSQDMNKTKGVIHNITTTEHRSEWSETNKSWNDVTSTKTKSTNSVAFTLGNDGDKYKIAVSEPLLANKLEYNTVFYKFEPVQSTFPEKILGYASGSNVKGYETREEMLIEGTKLTGIGKIEFVGGELRLSPPKYPLSYILSTASLGSIVDKEAGFARLIKWFSVIFAIGSCLCLSFWMYRKLKAWYEARQRKLEFDRLSAENMENREDFSGRECVVCLHNPRNVVILDCGHICVCRQCSARLSICPICRSNVAKIVPTFETT